jgi:dTDP-4-dehydrorhamnose 3,5-epimerase
MEVAITSDAHGRGLPEGVIVRPLVSHVDARGSLAEVYREHWVDGGRAMQFNAVRSEPGVLRGVHAHATHLDYIVLLEGRMLLGLHDLRPSSPTARVSSLIECDGHERSGIVIPAGVAHGFYFLQRSLVLYGLAREWDASDEFTCRWDSEELGLAWPTRAPLLSERDAGAADYAAMDASFERVWAVAQAGRSRTRAV